MHPHLRWFLSATRLALLGLLIVAATAARAASSVPSPGNSTIPSCLLTTPGGNIVDVVIVRDLASNPINNSLVVLDYDNCPGFVPCPQGGGAPGDNYVVDPVAKTIRLFTSSQGQAPFYLRAGGGCSGNGIRISADGVLLGQIRAASADQNGDLAVDGADFALIASKIGTSDLSGDLNCDGVVDVLDQYAAMAYNGVNCLDPTDTHHRSWGSVKTIYR